MILINLLPHREEKRRQRKRAFYATLVASALCGLAVAGIWYAALQQLTSAQQARSRETRSCGASTVCQWDGRSARWRAMRAAMSTSRASAVAMNVTRVRARFSSMA